MNETSNDNHMQSYKNESDKEVCISDLSPSAIRGAVKAFELLDEVAFNAAFN